MKVIEDNVQGTMNEVLRSSHRLSKSVKNKEEIINKALDIILEFSVVIQEQINQLSSINNSLSRLTWITDTSNKQDIEDIEIILQNLNDLRDNELKAASDYLNHHSVIAKDCPKIVRAYLDEIDDLEENMNDVYNAFFVLPYDEEYQEIQRMIAEKC